MAPAPVITVEEYLRTPESVLPHELAFGVLRVADAPTPRHQSVGFAFGVAIDRHVRSLGLGRMYLSPVDVILDPRRHLVVQPDLVFISTSRLDLVRDRIWGAPDLALEVLSPRPRIGSIDERLGWFAEYGVRECWLVHQHERTIEVVELADGAVQSRSAHLALAPIHSRVLPDWRLSMADVLDGHPDAGGTWLPPAAWE